MDEYIWPIAKKFFVTSGKGEADTPKGAVHRAFIKGKVNQCNLDTKSSVLYGNAIEVDISKIEIPHSAQLDCVLAEESGVRGQSIASGIAYAFMKNQNEIKAYVVEDHGKKEEIAIKEILIETLADMAEAENLHIIDRNNPSDYLLNKKEWLEKQIYESKHFDYFGGAEKLYKKYLMENSDKFIKTRIEGIDKIKGDNGYIFALLGFLYEK